MRPTHDTLLLRMASLAAALWLAGCGAPLPATAPASGVTPPTPSAPGSSAVQRYRCDQGIAFTVRFRDGEAVIDAGSRGTETLLRDAGGLTPQQTVYSSTRLRADFGLGADGRGAVLYYLSPALEARCTRD